MALTPPPLAPDVRDRPSFATRADARVAWESQHVEELVAFQASLSTIASGGAYAIPFKFSTTTTDADPGPGFMRLSNSTTQNAATVIRLDTQNLDGLSVAALLDSFDDSTSSTKGTIRLVRLDDPTKWLVFKLTALGNQTGYRNLSVTPIMGSSSAPFVSNDTVMFHFQPTGDVGTPGTQVRRATSIVTSPTPTPNASNTDLFEITALAEAATFGLPTGTPLNGQQLMLRIKDSGVSRALNFNAIYRAGTDLALPSATSPGKWLRLGFEYNSTDGKWDFIGMLNNI